jgi:hypothetical protein
MQSKTRVAHIELKDIKQTAISDTWKTKLCTALCNIQICCGIMLTKGLLKNPFSISDIDRIVDEAVKNGGLSTKDGENSDNGYVANHEKIAEAAGLPGKWKKLYPRLDADGLANILALLQWGSPVELRDEGKHSLLATGSYLENGIIFLEVIDPWPYTDDKRLNTKTNMTQKKNEKGEWVDSRSIEFYGWYKNLISGWL